MSTETFTLNGQDARYFVLNSLITLHTVLIPLAQRLLRQVQDELSEGITAKDAIGQDVPPTLMHFMMVESASNGEMSSAVVMLQRAKGCDPSIIQALRCYSARGDSEQFRGMDNFQTHAAQVQLGQRAVDVERMLAILQPSVPYGKIRFPEW